MMKAQMEKNKTRAQEIEGELGKANKGKCNIYFLNTYIVPIHKYRAR